jgi:hypothetical protein
VLIDDGSGNTIQADFVIAAQLGQNDFFFA